MMEQAMHGKRVYGENEEAYFPMQQQQQPTWIPSIPPAASSQAALTEKPLL